MLALGGKVYNFIACGFALFAASSCINEAYMPICTDSESGVLVRGDGYFITDRRDLAVFIADDCPSDPMILEDDTGSRSVFYINQPMDQVVVYRVRVSGHKKGGVVHGRDINAHVEDIYPDEIKNYVSGLIN